MRLDWASAPREYETGLDRGVLYTDTEAHPWSGLTSMDESSVDTVETDYFLDGVRRVTVQESGDFQASAVCYTYPTILDERRGPFGLTYRVQKGESHLIHVVYNAYPKMVSRGFTTMSDGVDPSLIPWDISATPERVFGLRPTSHLVMDTGHHEDVTRAVEDILYGTDVSDARFPTIQELIDIFESVTTLKIRYNPDGSWTATGPDDVVRNNPDGTVTINSPTLVFKEDGRFTVSSY